MLSKTLTSLAAIVASLVNVQAVPQFEEATADGAVRGPPMLVRDVPNPPPPPSFVGAMLVNDAAHPFRPPRKGDLRGPCPGLNTLANHGWLPRDGVATPAQIITAVQDGFNMASTAARVTTYGAHLLDGNLEYDLLSIGGKTPKTGPDPPAPAIVGGLNNHGTFEGDASLTRADAFFGNNFIFNPALFEQFKNFSRIYGNGFYNHTVAGELRYHRIQESIRTNPKFEILGFRHTTAYDIGQLDMVTAERFFKDAHFPEDFYRSATPVDASAAALIYAAHPTEPGRNVNGVNTFEVDHSIGSLTDICGFYAGFVNIKIKNLYPNPTGLLRKNLIKNLQFFYDTFGGQCEQIFPYGQE
ncbi:Chloroperoxidase [Coprinopsis sp. MPI-PUGE-AT-0042]|nr:Chloroperoxidase [Coprinopsis sp. MPI-PUGE-AT-0042]